MTESIEQILCRLPAVEPTPAQSQRIWHNICRRLGWDDESWLCDSCGRLNYAGNLCGHCKQPQGSHMTQTTNGKQNPVSFQACQICRGDTQIYSLRTLTVDGELWSVCPTCYRANTQQGHMRLTADELVDPMETAETTT